jgi:hypothetical protein
MYALSDTISNPRPLVYVAAVAEFISSASTTTTVGYGLLVVSGVRLSIGAAFAHASSLRINTRNLFCARIIRRTDFGVIGSDIIWEKKATHGFS